MNDLTRKLQDLLTQATAARLAEGDTDEFRMMVANWQLADLPLSQVIDTVANVTKSVVGGRKLDRDEADFAARQIVDDCWRAGVDIQFQQHLVEGLLRGLMDRGISP